MVSQKEIESVWVVYKLLITGITNYKMLAFKLGQFDIYLQNLEPIQSIGRARVGNTWYMKTQKRSPYIATVRTPFKGNVDAFIAEMKEFRTYRIFKSALWSKPKKHTTFTGRVLMNALGLRAGKTFYITSEDKKLRTFFYEMAVVLNKEHDFGCTFDYDVYDYKLEIKKYNKPNGQTALITVMSGKDMPNDYKTTEYVPRDRYNPYEFQYNFVLNSPPSTHQDGAPVASVLILPHHRPEG